MDFPHDFHADDLAKHFTMPVVPLSCHKKEFLHYFPLPAAESGKKRLERVSFKKRFVNNQKAISLWAFIEQKQDASKQLTMFFTNLTYIKS